MVWALTLRADRNVGFNPVGGARRAGIIQRMRVRSWGSLGALQTGRDRCAGALATTVFTFRAVMAGELLPYIGSHAIDPDFFRVMATGWRQKRQLATTHYWVIRC